MEVRKLLALQATGTICQAMIMDPPLLSQTIKLQLAQLLIYMHDEQLSPDRRQLLLARQVRKIRLALCDELIPSRPWVLDYLARLGLEDLLAMPLRL